MKARKPDPLAALESIMRMLRERAEDGRINIADKGVETFIRDAVARILNG